MVIQLVSASQTVLMKRLFQATYILQLILCIFCSLHPQTNHQLQVRSTSSFKMTGDHERTFVTAGILYKHAAPSLVHLLSASKKDNPWTQTARLLMKQFTKQLAELLLQTKAAE